MLSRDHAHQLVRVPEPERSSALDIPFPTPDSTSFHSQIKPFVGLTKILLRELAVGDIDTRSYITGKRVILIESRHTNIENPPIFSVEMSKPIFHAELLTSLKSLCVGLNAPFQVLTVHPLGPAVSKLLRDRSSREVQPGFIEVGAEFVCSRHPNQHGSGIGNQAEAGFAFLDLLFRSLALRNVCYHADRPHQPALFVEVSATIPLHPNYSTVGACHANADLKIRFFRTEGGNRSHKLVPVFRVNRSQYSLASSGTHLINPKYLGGFCRADYDISGSIPVIGEHLSRLCRQAKPLFALA